MALKIVTRMTNDILEGDTVYFALDCGYGQQLRALSGRVTGDDSPKNSWYVNVNGAVMLVKHHQIYALEPKEQ